MNVHQNKKVEWVEMFPDELHQKIQDEPVCYLAFGLAEPHGPYNALGLDWLKAHALVKRAAQKHGGVVAPPSHGISKRGRDSTMTGRDAAGFPAQV